ncbi:MAG: hypothetical protein H7222_14515 [Methylotenera sp.]|nr:hypothetical protein [Oligoflexia bacterium]
MTMKLEERLCACGCGKIFKCLPTSQTRYSSLFCMELAGELPVTEKSGYGAKAARPVKKMKTAVTSTENRREESQGHDESLVIPQEPRPAKAEPAA